MRELIGELDAAGYTAAAACLADDLDALVAHLRYLCATADGERTCWSGRWARSNTALLDGDDGYLPGEDRADGADFGYASSAVLSQDAYALARVLLAI